MRSAFRCGVPLVTKQPARKIGGRRFVPRQSSKFHSSSPVRLSIFPWGTNDPNEHDDSENRRQHDDQPLPNATEAIDTKSLGNGGQSNSQNGRSPNHGSAARRWMRNRRPKDIPPIVIPSWFLARNVKLREDDEPYTEGSLELTGGNIEDRKVAAGLRQEVDESSNPLANAEQSSSASADEHSNDPATEPRTYRLKRALMGEVLASISAGLSTTHTESAETFLSGKSHLRLHCPLDGGTYFLEKIVEEAASTLQADVVRLDAQDLAEITSSYVKEGPDATSNSLWSLGYDSQREFPKPQSEPVEPDEDGMEGETEDFADADMDQSRQQRSPRGQPQWTMTTVPLGTVNLANPGALMKTIKEQFEGRGIRGPGGRGSGSGGMPSGMTPFGQSSPNPAQQRNDFKLGALLEALVEANQIKRVDPMLRGNLDVSPGPAERGVKDGGASEAPQESAVQENTNTLSLVTSENLQEAAKSHPPWPLPRTVLLVRGYKELSTTHQGRLILEKLDYIVQKKRKEGQQIVLVGTTASAELTPEISRSAFESLQSDGQETPFRTIVVTPDEAGPAGGLYYRDTSRRVKEINVRHLHDMVNRVLVSSTRSATQDLDTFSKGLDFGPGDAALASMLEEQVFSFDEVHRIVLTALGKQIASEGETADKQSIRADQIVEAMRLLDESDGAKTEWANDEQQLQQKPAGSTQDSKSSAAETRLKKLRKTCNHHEKSLLRGVVNPENIRTTFRDVHAPPETIESLKNLTTLSLTRPEAFKYGVLATDKITGLLLYGPPGTGKTLLAKAVAKESGATVLEVSGSDVYDMYVGESEKNVRAIFTLARKLSPCVVFVDEADAIFASRGSGTNRSSHKELINQFLREWDGMTDTNAFIMVATNRPFDLDDAALRRLPRRLLVDLPVEKDREAILGIHLKEEALESSVSLAHLAAQTPLYSGSDLKNLAVAAALTAVREENDAAAKHRETSDEPFVFPERRILTTRHFEKAMEEITASVSDDMSSLGAIRKFDEQYGDRRGKKKRKGGYGFAGGEGVKEDAIKVRS